MEDYQPDIIDPIIDMREQTKSFIAGLIISPWLSFVYGWALWCHWDWFVCPIAGFDLPLLHAIGLSMTARVMTCHLRHEDMKERDTRERVFFAFAVTVTVGICTGCAAIVAALMG